MQCKEGYEEAWHENTCQIGLCDFISVSLEGKAAIREYHLLKKGGEAAT